MSAFFLADDLSGALDAAAAFHAVGQQVTIALTREAWPEPRAGEVVGFTTETRNADPAAAASTVARAVADGRAKGARLVYKKIDSTARGPVAAELAALATALPNTRILFTPANPGAGRTVRDGILLVQGRPVAETEFGRDPVSPVGESSLRKLLGSAATDRVVIADAATAEDLAAAVARINGSGQPWVAVGSGALARPVAARVFGASAGRTNAATVRGDPRHSDAAPCLFVCGSAHARNREQAAVLAKTRAVDVHAVRAGETGVAEIVRSALAAQRSPALLMHEERTDSDAVVRWLAATVARLVADTALRRLFITGGETAFAICRELGIATLRFEREVESGVALATADARKVGPVRLAIKPGAFGDQDTWVRVYDALRGETYFT